MSESISIDEFFNLCKRTLAQAELSVDTPTNFRNVLDELDSILRTHWPEIIIKINEEVEVEKLKLEAETIFEKIKKLELISNSRLSIFNGMENIIKKSKDR